MSSVTVAPELLVFVLDAAVAVADVDVVDVDARRRRKDGESSGDVDETTGDGRVLVSVTQAIGNLVAFKALLSTRHRFSLTTLSNPAKLAIQPTTAEEFLASLEMLTVKGDLSPVSPPNLEPIIEELALLVEGGEKDDCDFFTTRAVLVYTHGRTVPTLSVHASKMFEQKLFAVPWFTMDVVFLFGRETIDQGDVSPQEVFDVLARLRCDKDRSYIVSICVEDELPSLELFNSFAVLAAHPIQRPPFAQSLLCDTESA